MAEHQFAIQNRLTTHISYPIDLNSCKIYSFAILPSIKIL